MHEILAIIASLFFSIFILSPSFGIGLFDNASYTVTQDNRSFLDVLSMLESSNDHTKVNTLGYIGKYQFGESALIATGYYTKDSSVKNDWKGKWTGKSGIFSKEDFLSRPSLQDKVALEFTKINWQTAKRLGLDKYVGRTVRGIRVTNAAILAGIHLKGVVAVKNFLKHSVDSSDAYGTEVSSYMKKLSNHTVSL